MSTITASYPMQALSPPLPLHRFSVAQYHGMIASGVFTKDNRVELLEGWIVNKMPHNPAHDGTIDLFVGEVQPFLLAEWFLRVQSAITTADSEPEPDIAVVRGPRSRYIARHPVPNDIGQITEVSDSTLAQDRTVKASLYGRAGVAIYWIVNIPEARVEVYTEPFAGEDAAGYRNMCPYGRGDNVPVVLDGQQVGTIAVNALFPKQAN